MKHVLAICISMMAAVAATADEDAIMTKMSVARSQNPLERELRDRQGRGRNRNRTNNKRNKNKNAQNGNDLTNSGDVVQEDKRTRGERIKAARDAIAKAKAEAKAASMQTYSPSETPTMVRSGERTVQL